ncbi:MAG: serine/threonine-protein kinase [Polyangiaceae bacterium]
MSSPKGPGPRAHAAQDAATIPSDPELGSAPTVAATTVAVDSITRKKKLDPFTLVSGESISPQVDAHGGDLEGTGGAARYERGAVIGAGGMGEVRLHLDRRIGRRVAKKTLHSTLDSGTARQRFVREARVQGQLEHPAIVPVYDLDIDADGRAFFTMKRVRGQTLERVLDRLRAGDLDETKRFSQRKLLTAFAQVCLAIDYAHTRGVIHRDLKPGNIMLGDFGEVYVLDWGLAKVVGESDEDSDAPQSVPVLGASTALTRMDALLGTPAYMAPEQLLRRTEDVDARSDVFALGAILFEILSGAPFRGTADLAEILRRLPTEHLLRPSERRPDVAPELDELCARALEYDRAHRPARARDLAESVEAFLDGEHDTNLRRELSARHAEAARRRARGEPVHDPSHIKDSPAGSIPPPSRAPVKEPAPARVEAFRETMQALALDADNRDAQQLLVELLTDVSGEVPEAAQRELDDAEDRARKNGAKAGVWGLLLWLAVFPATVIIGVRSWPAVLALAGTTALAALYCYWLWTRTRYSTRALMVLVAMCAGVTAMTSCYLGPFAVVSTCAATASIQFALQCRKSERPLFTAIISLGAVAPFLAEWLGVFPRAYAFEADRMLVFARAVALPQGATTSVMAYSTLTFTVFAAILMGRLRDNLRAHEHRHFLQAWYLREIFPAGGGVERGGGAPL